MTGRGLSKIKFLEKCIVIDSKSMKKFRVFEEKTHRKTYSPVRDNEKEL